MASEKQTVKYVDKKMLLRIRRYEKKRGYNFNQMLDDKSIARMSDTLRLPVILHFLHNDIEIRVVVALPTGTMGLVDMPFEFFNKLPEVSYETRPDSSKQGTKRGPVQNKLPYPAD